MANFSISFYSSKESIDVSKLDCFANVNNEITLCITNLKTNESEDIMLDVSTSIKLAKALRTEINKIKS